LEKCYSILSEFARYFRPQVEVTAEDHKPEAGNPKPEIRNPKSETNPNKRKLETPWENERLTADCADYTDKIFQV